MYISENMQQQLVYENGTHSLHYYYHVQISSRISVFCTNHSCNNFLCGENTFLQ